MVLRKWIVKFIIYVSIFSIISCLAVSALSYNISFNDTAVSFVKLKDAGLNNAKINNLSKHNYYVDNAVYAANPSSDNYHNITINVSDYDNIDYFILLFSSLYSNQKFVNSTYGTFTYKESFVYTTLAFMTVFDVVPENDKIVFDSYYYNSDQYTITKISDVILIPVVHSNIDDINDSVSGLLNITQSIFGFIMSSPLVWVLLGVTVSFIGWCLYQIKRII